MAKAPSTRGETPHARPAGERLHTLPQVADRLQVSLKTVRRTIARGQLAAHRVGRQLRVAERDLQHYLRETWISGRP